MGWRRSWLSPPPDRLPNDREGFREGLRGMHRGSELVTLMYGKPAVGARMGAGALRVSAPCLTGAGSAQVPGIGGDAPDAALLASDDCGACAA
jgi:hypothetical protein